MPDTLLINKPFLVGRGSPADWGLGGENKVADGMYKLTAKLLAKVAFIGAALIGSPAAHAEDLGQIPTGETLVLPFDASAVSDVIAVEIDGVDVTEFVRVENGKISISPGAPLAAGSHTVIIYILAGNTYSVAGEYNFQTQTSVGDSGPSVSVVATHEIGTRSTNGNREYFANSAGEARLETLDKSVTVRLNYLATTREGDQIDGRPFNLGEYLIELRQNGSELDLSAKIGHQTLSYDTVLINNTTRRGISLEASRPNDRVQVGLFALKTSEVLGADNILGIEEDGDRMVGGRFAFKPFFGSDLRVSVQSYEGEGVPKLGSLPGIGSGTSVSLDGTAVDGRLRYAAAYAHTKWDEDGPLFLDREEGDAVLASLDYDVLTGENGRNLTFGIRYERVDESYFSLANIGLPIGTGKDKIQITADYATERLTLFTSFDTARTTYRNYIVSPVDRISRVALDGTYALMGPGWLSDTTLRFGGAYDWQKRQFTPAFAPPAQDWEGTTLYLGLEKNTDLGGWGIDYTYIDENNVSNPDLDRRSNSISGWIDRSINERLNIALNSTLTQFETPFPGTYWRREGALALGYEIDPARLNLALDVGLIDTEEPGAENGSYVTGTLTWSVHPSADLVFNAGYYDGSYATKSSGDHDAVVGMRLRIQTNLFR